MKFFAVYSLPSDPTFILFAFLLIGACIISFRYLIHLFLGGDIAERRARAGSLSYKDIAANAKSSASEEFSILARHSEIQAMRKMLERKAILADGENAFGRGWLQYFATIGNVEACRLLLEFGARPQDKDSSGKSAFDAAEGNSQLDLLFKTSSGGMNTADSRVNS